ncbi:MAG: glycosyltransferase [Bacteroidota bacterium]
MKRVCMIGWEFPPHLNGGLGVACQGLVEAMAPLTELRLILPKTSGIPTSPDWELKSVQGMRLPEVIGTRRKIITEELRKVNVRMVDVNISGYERLERVQVPVEDEEVLILEKAVYEKAVMRPAGDRFYLALHYGPDLQDRVTDYAELATLAALEAPFDVIHAHDWMSFPAGMALKAQTGKPLVLHVHSTEYDRVGPTSKGWTYQIEKHAFEQADLILAVSQYTADLIHRHYGVPQSKLQVVHNGIQPVQPYQQAAPFDQPLVVFLGRLTGQKGPDFFFDAACELLEERERDIRFVIAGKGDLIESLVLEAEDKALGHRVHFTGFLEPDRVKDLLAMADVFVMPSRSEPFGLSALEAAQMGVPCIITENAGVGEVLPSALRVPFGEVDTLADQIEALLDNAELRGSVARKQLIELQQVSWHKAAEQVLEAYESL